jgi:hypothetical protein
LESNEDGRRSDAEFDVFETVLKLYPACFTPPIGAKFQAVQGPAKARKPGANSGEVIGWSRKSPRSRYSGLEFGISRVIYAMTNHATWPRIKMIKVGACRSTGRSFRQVLAFRVVPLLRLLQANTCFEHAAAHEADWSHLPRFPVQQYYPQ